MQTDKLPTWAKIIGYLFGAGLVFIGGRFLIASEVGERGYGLIYDQPNNAFHSIKGIRDLFSGLLFIAFTAANWRKPLAVVMLLGSLIPVVDMIIVLTSPTVVQGAEWIHGTTAVTIWIYSYFLLRKRQRSRSHQPHLNEPAAHS